MVKGTASKKNANYERGKKKNSARGNEKTVWWGGGGVFLGGEGDLPAYALCWQGGLTGPRGAGNEKISHRPAYKSCPMWFYSTDEEKAHPGRKGESQQDTYVSHFETIGKTEERGKSTRSGNRLLTVRSLELVTIPP